MVGIWEIEIRFCSWVCPHTVRLQSLYRPSIAAGASWQVPSSHNFRLMDPLGYAAGEAQFVDGSWMVGQTVPVPKASPLEAALVATEDRSFHGFG